jgi:hypothetical protein
MKKRKFLKGFYAVIAITLCALMISSAFALTSCQSANNSDAGVVDTEERRSVVRVKKGVLAGKQISGENLEVCEVPVSGIPEGAIDNKEAIVGKYATTNMVIGEYVFDRMLTTEAPPKEEIVHTYIVVSDMISNVHTRDITEDLQLLIDKNPNKTIYFNDGEYTISSTIYLPSEPDKSVSFRLSNHAKIKAASNWSGEGAMISIGGKSAANSAKAENALFGGIIDGAGVAKVGVSVENAESTFISDVTLQNLATAMHVKSTANVLDVEGVTVNGGSVANAVGILNEGSKSVFSTINMANVLIGVKNSGSYNEFRNVSVAHNQKSLESVGFYEQGENNVFDLCTAENFAKGYYIKDGAKSVYEACNSYWTSAELSSQTAFFADGVFSSVITASTARFFDETSTNAYLACISSNGGVIKAPIFATELCDNDSYKMALSGAVIPIK